MSQLHTRHMWATIALAASLLAFPSVISALDMPVDAFQQATPAKKKVEVTLVQVLGDKVGKPNVPKEIRAYAKNLNATGNRHFKVASKKKVKLEVGKPQQVGLVKGLGRVTLQLRKDGKVVFAVKAGRQSSKVVLPIKSVFADDKIKTKDGKQLILILDPPAKKPTKTPKK